MENYIRPNPDELLRKIKQENESLNKGKLKIYLGMCAGVGKTFSMLQDASKESGKGRDVVIGYVETHGRAETEFLLFHLEQLPRKQIQYKSITIEEFDLDALLKRKPDLVVIDELAHTNAESSRHKKRYQDVLEVLSYGIDVYTAVNVQHFESRTDFVYNITGIQIQETVPDSILDIANEIELIDLSPEDLLVRLEEGKVYTKDKTKNAIENFFRKGNLIALREISLRMTADRVDKQLRDYMKENRIPGPWKSGQRLMVAISSSPASAQLIRMARKISYTMEASMVVLNVETPENISDKNKKTLNSNIELAKSLGAEFISTSDDDFINAIIRVARQENVTDIVLGKSGKRGILSKRILYNLIKKSGNIDIFIAGNSEDKDYNKKIFKNLKHTSSLIQYIIAVLIIFLSSLILYPISGYLGYQSVALILLFIVSLMPLIIGMGPVLLACGLSPLIWDFYFVPPQFTLQISRTEDFLLFILFFIIAIVTGILSGKVRNRELLLRRREKNAISLYKLASDLSVSVNRDEVKNAFIKNVNKVFNAECEIFFADDNNIIPHITEKISSKDYSILQWVYLNKRPAGITTDTLPNTEYLFLPITGPRGVYGTAAIKFNNKNLYEDEKNLINTFMNQLGTAVEREILSETASKAKIFQESDKLYKNLFDSISHELKTPISAIIAGATMMNSDAINSTNKKYIIDEILTASQRLNSLVENLLNMTRLETGKLILNKHPFDLTEIIVELITEVKKELINKKLKYNFLQSELIISADVILIQQALSNVLKNFVKYSKPNGEIEITLGKSDQYALLTISDDGPGIDNHHLVNIFEKFYRVNNSVTGGIGLGLSISKGFIEAHGGSISAENNSKGGVTFIIKLPLNILETQ